MCSLSIRPFLNIQAEKAAAKAEWDIAELQRKVDAMKAAAAEIGG